VKTIETALPGVLIVEPDVFGDARGFFLEAFRAEQVAAFPGAGSGGIVQLNHSRSVRGTVRGLHFQEPRAQGKLVWVVRGSILDVVVDIRRGSPRFGKHTTIELDEEKHRRVWVPPGFAHGFSVLSESADCLYACTDYYAPDCDRAVAWNDPALAIDWRVTDALVSPKDAAAPFLADAQVLPKYVK
jgi:dTDP-4-dehydrorhamnose 3,5-epimerase